MKNSFLLLSFLILFNASAQDKTNFGIKAGLNLSRLAFKDIGVYPDMKYKPGFHVGGVVLVPLNKKISLQPEILYSNQGYKLQYSDVSVNEYYKAVGTIDYLHIPFVVKYYPTTKFNLEAGAQFGFLLKHTNEVELTIVDIADSNNTQIINSSNDVKKYYQKYEGSFIIGAQYSFNKNLFSSLRFTQSISKINKELLGLGYEDTSKERNVVFQLSVGYLFN